MASHSRADKRTLNTPPSKKVIRTNRFYKNSSVNWKREKALGESKNLNDTETRSKLSFSSRNSLRTAQSFANYSNSNEMQHLPYTMPRYLDCDTYYPSAYTRSIKYLADPDYHSIVGLGDRKRHYSILTSECFIRTDQKNMVCLLCNLEEKFRSEKTILRHLASEQHNQFYNKLRFTLTNITPYMLSLQMRSIDKLLNRWFDDQHLELSHIKNRLLIAQGFIKFVKSIDSTCECRLVGSYLSGTPLKSSNIDLELVHPNSKIFLDDPRAKKSIHHRLIDPQADYGLQINLHTLHYDLVPNAVTTLYDIMKFVKTNPACEYSLQSQPRDLMCKVPKLSMKHKESEIRIDLICYSESSCKQAILLNTYLSLDDRARILALLIKHWAKICKIDNPDQGTFPPGIFLILLIYYLQRVSPPVLPCLHEAIIATNKDKHEEETCNLLNKLNINAANCKLTNEVNSTKENYQNILSPDGADNGKEICEDYVDDEEEEDSTNYDLDNEEIRNLNWKSKNDDSVCILFVDFLKNMMKEFDNLSTIISIRTLAPVGLQEKDWVTQVKAIENPIKPRVNMSRCIGTIRTFEFIKRCFRHGYYYLTSIPFDAKLKPKTEIQTDPRDFIELYVHNKRLDRMYTERKKILGSPRSAYKILIERKLFSRDVEAINAVYEDLNALDRDAESLYELPCKVASFYQEDLLIPKDILATTFCWLCRKNGHSRNTCPKLTLDRLKEDIYFYKPELDNVANFDDIFTHFFTDHMITKRLADQHELMLAELADLINTRTGMRCQLQLFGSTVNDLGSYDSDLDICMTLEDNLTGKGVDCVQVLQIVSKVLDETAEVARLEPILSARVPIIRFEYKGFDVDLSMYNQCAIYNSKLLKTYASFDGRVAKLFYLVKRFAKSCEIADASKGSLSSYAWSLLVIHYLQHIAPPILPVLQETSNSEQKPIIGINGWNVWFDIDRHKSFSTANQSNITQLFKGFFFYYGSIFDFRYSVVSIRKFEVINRLQKNWHTGLMAIEDPFELTYNLAGRLDEPMALYIINSFAQAFRHTVKIQEILVERKGQSKFILAHRIFNGRDITGSSPPYRGCRVCHRIGHRVKDCPEKNRHNREGIRLDNIAANQSIAT